MRSRYACLAVIVLTLAVLTVASVAAEPAQVDRKQREAEALEVIDRLEKAYVFFDLKGIRADWKTRRKDWEKQAKDLQDDTALLALVQECVDCLRDGHMYIKDPALPIPSTQNYFSGLYFGETDKHRVVVVNDITGTYPPAGPGVEVLTIDGQNAKKYLDKASEDLWNRGGSFSSPQRAAMMVWRWGLMGEQNATHKLVVQSGRDKREFTARNQFQCRMYPETLPKLTDLTICDTDKTVSWRLLEPVKKQGKGKQIGYIYIRSLSGTTDASVAKGIEAMGKPEGLVIDISDNGGGGGYTLDSLQSYKGKVAAIISPRCFSAGETYARDLVNGVMAKLFGQTTAGSSSEKDSLPLPRKLGEVIYSTRSRNGIKQCIEFHGIAPDEEVLFDPADLEKGVSTVIVRAQEWVAEKVGK